MEEKHPWLLRENIPFFRSSFIHAFMLFRDIFNLNQSGLRHRHAPQAIRVLFPDNY
jgi:hypothetical protein